jgi:hypothetical protein
MLFAARRERRYPLFFRFLRELSTLAGGYKNRRFVYY